MIWYRHWLEMRFRAGLGLLAILSFTLIFQTHRLNPSLADTAMVRLLGIEGSRSLMAHAMETAVLVLTMTAMAAGTGIVSYGIGTGKEHRSTVYTLSLPVSRARIYATRLAAGWLQVCAGFTLVFAANCALLSWYGDALPWRAMAVASIAGSIITLPALAFTNMLIVAFGMTAGATGGALATLFSLWGFAAIWGSSIQGIIPWAPVAIALALAAAVFAATLPLLRRQEF